MSRVRIDEARVLVTGGGSGIGRAIALRCARGGASVVAVDINAEAAATTAAECGGDAAWRACDVADADAVVALAEEVESTEGPVDVLVNNAGVGIGGPFLEASLEDWDWLRGINYDGVAYGCHAFGARMVERGHGQVVNIASGAAYISNRHMAAYCGSKAAVFAFSACLREDWRSAGVGVSVICPGVINTGIHTRSRMFGSVTGREEQIGRLFRLGHSPDVVAKAVIRAVERNQAVVPVGIESTAAYRLLPFVPGPAKSLITRLG